MADGLGIKIKIDYPTASEIQKEFESKVNQPLEIEAKLKESSFSRIQDEIRNIANEPINIEFNTGNALSQIQQINQELQQMRELTNTEISFGGMAQAFEEASRSAEQFRSNVDQSTSATKNKRSSIEDIARVQRELTELQQASVNASSAEKQVYSQRIQELTSQLSHMKAEHKEAFNPQEIHQAAQQIGEMNVSIRDTAEGKKVLKNGQREYTRLLNEEYKIRQQLDGATGTHADALQRQLQIVQQQQQEVYQHYNLKQNLNAVEQAAIDSLVRQGEAQRQITQAKNESKTAAQEQSATYKTLKSDLNQIHKMQSKIAELQAKADAGIQTGKENEQLQSLQQQLQVRENIFNVQREKAQAEGTLSQEANNSLDAIQRQYDAKSEVRQATIDSNVAIQEQRRAYDEVYEGIRRIDGLNKQLSTAGREQANVIRQQIDAENERINSKMQALDAENNINAAKARGIEKLRAQQAEQTQLAQQQSTAMQMDTYENISMIDSFNPRRVYSQARRVGNMIYSEVAALDEQLIQIEKVAQATEAETQRFHDSIFDFASEVGKGAQEYGVAVERWVMQGHELAEATELARESMIGAFVGNTNEADMVDYLSVPARSWTDEFGNSMYEVSDILNTMNEVANNNAIMVDDLGAAYKKASQTALQSGMEFEQMTGLITGANDATRQGGQMIGTAMRNINMNFATISAELTDDAKRKADFFREVGVPLLDTNGSLRNTYDIIGDLNGVWGDLSEQQQTTAAFYAAEKRHAPILQAMVTNWDAVEKATGEAYEQTSLLNKEQGSAYREFEQQQDSIQYRAAQLQNSWTELMTTISGGRSGIGEVLDMLNRGLERVIELVDRPGFGTALKNFLGAAAFTTASMAISKFSGAVSGHLSNIGNNLKAAGHNGVVFANKLSGGLLEVGSSALQANESTSKFLNIGKSIGSDISSVVGMTLSLGKLAVAAWGVNEVAKIMFDVDLLGEAYNWFQRITGQMTDFQQELQETGRIQEEALENFYSSDFMSGSVREMDQAISDIVDRFGLEGISDKAGEAKSQIESYGVQVGDTLSGIADEHGITLEELIEMNPDIEDPSMIFEGQEIHIEVDATGEVNTEWEDLSPEEFLELKTEIETMAEEHLPEEVAKDITLHINSEDDIRFTFGNLRKAMQEEAARQIGEAAEEFDTAIQAAANRESYGDFELTSGTSVNLLNPVKNALNGEMPALEREFSQSLQDLISAGLATAEGEITERGERVLASGASDIGSAFINNIAAQFDDGRESIRTTHAKYYEALRELSEMSSEAVESSMAYDEEELKQRNNAIRAAHDQRIELLQNLTNEYVGLDIGRIAEEFEDVDTFMNSAFVGTLASVGTHTQSASDHFDTLRSALETVRESGDDLDGVMTEIPHNVLRSLAEVIPELQGMPQDLTNDLWDDINLDHIGNQVTEQSEAWLRAMAQTFEQAGSLADWHAFQNEMSDGVTGVLEVMNLLASETDQTFDELAIQFGVTSRTMANYGDEIFDVMIGYQDVLEGLDGEYVTRYSLETEQGTIDMAAIDAINALPEQVRTHFELVDSETGMVNLENIEGMLNNISDPELRHMLSTVEVLIDEDHTGNESWDLAKLDEVFSRNEEVRQQFIAELDMPEDVVNEIYDLDGFIARVAMTLEDGEFDERVKRAREAIDDMDGDTIDVEAIIEDSGFNADLLDKEDRIRMLNELGIEVEAEADIDLSKFQENEIIIMEAISQIDRETAIANVDLNEEDFDEAKLAVLHELGIIDASEAVPDINANDDPLIQVLEDVESAVNTLNERLDPVGIRGDRTDFNETVEGGVSWANNQSGTVSIGANTSSLTDSIRSALSAFTTWTIDVVMGGSSSPGGNRSGSSGGGRRGNSNRRQSAVIQPQIGRAFSRSVSDALSDTPAMNTTFSNSGDDRPPSRVDSDVWRYWSRELYRGMPLDSSMADLDRAIQDNTDNHEKLIPLYQQQIRLIDQQIRHERDMLNRNQSEMNHLLSELRGLGFRSNGNEITNLGHARSLRGDRADEANDLLRQYRSLYETMESTRQSIASLQQDRRGSQDSIQEARDAIEEEKIQKELEKIEKRLQRTEGLLTAISNDVDIFSTKLGFLDGGDFELELAITEEGINSASHNVQELVREFNRLSTMNIEYAENAEQVQSQLESLRGEILSNADAILDYRRSINDIEIDRMANDFSRFADVMDTNMNRITNNIDILRDGLSSGTSLDSPLVGLDFNRRSEIEREYQQRLELEANLNEVMNSFADKNVERSRNVANAQLTIEQQKYGAMLQMAQDYTNGRVSGSRIDTPTFEIGVTMADPSRDGRYVAWQNEMLSIADEYNETYGRMVGRYNEAMQNASTATERELLNHQMIVDQLEIQEDIYRQMTEANNRAIQEARTALNNSDLTTEQRQALQDMIRDYEESNLDAQNSIRDSVRERFELEYTLMERAITQSQRYSEELNHMLNIAEAINASGEAMEDIHESIFRSRLNEYATALQTIEQLEANQSEFEPGSYEWNIIEEQIEEIQSGLADLTIDILNANQQVLEQQISNIQSANERSALGMSLDEFNDYHDNWIDGIEKAYELEKLMRDVNALEDQTLMKRLELMDRQEAVTQNELEYAEMLIRAQQLREKLDNIGQERNVQTLMRDGSGNWQWGYVADQSEYDETQQELNELEIEMEQFRRDQQSGYVSSMNDILDRASSGEFSSMEDLMSAIEGVESIYASVLGDDLSTYDIDSILDAYRRYLENNEAIIDSTDMGTGGDSGDVARLSEAFSSSFLEISEDLGKTIGEELKRALKGANTVGGGNTTMTIQHQTLEFPNAKDSDEIADALLTLPGVVNQVVTGK